MISSARKPLFNRRAADCKSARTAGTAHLSNRICYMFNQICYMFNRICNPIAPEYEDL